MKPEEVDSIYFVTREYGGPEEGGWYYDWFEFKKSFKRSKRAGAISRLANYLNKKEGLRVGLGSVLSKGEYIGISEEFSGSLESKERPHYE